MVCIFGEKHGSALTQAECYHYLFDASIKMHQLGFDWSSTGHGPLPSGGVCRCLNNGRDMSKETLGSGSVTKLLQVCSILPTKMLRKRLSWTNMVNQNLESGKTSSRFI